MAQILSLQPVQKRAYALDALRGIAILLMILSSQQPFGKLPRWMFHAQSPPPTHAFNPAVTGITWVDLVFPFFIFAMAVAFPLALSKKITSQKISTLVCKSIKRGFILLAFAIYNRHMNPRVISSDPSTDVWLFAIFAFLLMIPMWARLPWALTQKTKKIIKFSAWIIAALTLTFIKYPDGTGFSLFRNNIILFVLADLAVFGSIIWLLTRNNINLRLGILAVLLAIKLSFTIDPSWIHTIGSTVDIPFIAPLIKNAFADKYAHLTRWMYDYTWFFQWRFLKYLFIAIPATIIGDLLTKWMTHTTPDSNTPRWSKTRLAAIALLMLTIIITSLSGLLARLSLITFITVSLLSLIALFLLKTPKTPDEKLISKMFQWAFFWLTLGFLFEPFENGIKKDPSTISYYFITTALAICTLIALIIIIDIMKKQKIMSILIDNGQNPMIAYAGASNLLNPILALIGLRPLLNTFYAQNPWPGFAVSLTLTILLALIVQQFTRKKIFLRT